MSVLAGNRHSRFCFREAKTWTWVPVCTRSRTALVLPGGRRERKGRPGWLDRPSGVTVLPHTQPPSCP